MKHAFANYAWFRDFKFKCALLPQLKVAILDRHSLLAFMNWLETLNIYFQHIIFIFHQNSDLYLEKSRNTLHYYQHQSFKRTIMFLIFGVFVSKKHQELTFCRGHNLEPTFLTVGYHCMILGGIVVVVKILAHE